MIAHAIRVSMPLVELVAIVGVSFVVGLVVGLAVALIGRRS